LAAEKSKEEEYEEWLGRLDIPIEAQADKETLRQYLRDELGITYDAQVDALWDATGKHIDLEEMGIRAVRIEYPWGVEIRYGIQGLPGLWGYDAVKQIMEEEE